MGQASFSKGAIGRGAIWSILNQSTAQVLGLLVFLTTARFVSKEAFGMMAVCLLVVETFRNVWADSIVTYVVAKKEPTDQDYNAAFWAILTGAILFALMLCVLAGPIAYRLNDTDIEPALRWISLLLVTTGLSRVHEAWLTKQLAFKALALRSLIAIVLGGSVGIYMAVHDYGLQSLIAQQVVTALVGMLCLWGTTSWRPRFEVQRSSLKAIFQQARYVSATAIASIASNQSDVFSSSYYLGAAQTGVYAAAKRIQIAISIMFSSSLGIVMLPTLSSVSDDPERRARNFLKTISLTSFISAALFAGVAVLSPELIAIVLGSKWADVAPIVSILAVNGFLTSISQYSVNVLLVMKKPQWNLWIAIVNAACNVPVFIIFGSMGLVPLAMAYVIKNVALFPLAMVPALRLLNIPTASFLRTITPSLIAACAVAIAIFLAKPHLPELSVLVRLFSLGLVGGVAYLWIMSIIDRPALAESYSVLRHLRKA